MTSPSLQTQDGTIQAVRNNRAKQVLGKRKFGHFVDFCQIEMYSRKERKRTSKIMFSLIVHYIMDGQSAVIKVKLCNK